MTRERILPLVAIVALALAACGSDETPDGPGAGSTVADRGVPSGTWRAVDGLVDGAPVALVDGFDVTLTVGDDHVSGRAACNSYGGDVTVDEVTVDDVTVDEVTVDEVTVGAGAFHVSGLSWTEMGCELDVMDVEQAFLRSLTDVDSWALDGDVLTLSGPTSSWTFESVPPVPDAEIAGTTWVLDAVVEGDVSSYSDVMSLATLRLDPDGTLTGSTSCRRLEGEWTVSGGEIVLTTFAAIDDPTAGICAPESQQLDSTIVTALGDGFTAEVDADRLTIRSQGGLGLTYVAA